MCEFIHAPRRRVTVAECLVGETAAAATASTALACQRRQQWAKKGALKTRERFVF